MAYSKVSGFSYFYLLFYYFTILLFYFSTIQLSTQLTSLQFRIMFHQLHL